MSWFKNSTNPEKEKITEEDPGQEPTPEDMDHLKIQFFPYILQALYNCYKLIELAKEGDDYKFTGSPWTSCILDASFCLDTLKTFGIYPKFRVRKNDDKTYSLRYISDRVLNREALEFAEIADLRDAHIENLEGQIQKLEEKIDEVKAAKAESVVKSDQDFMDKYSRIVSERQDLANKYNDARNQAKSCLAILRALMKQTTHENRVLETKRLLDKLEYMSGEKYEPKSEADKPGSCG